MIRALALLLLLAAPLDAQQCRARPISGTAPNSGGAIGVFLDGELVGQHTTARGAVLRMETLMEADSTAQVVIMEYLWGIWQDQQKRDCGPRSARPPWPIGLQPPPFAFDSVVTMPDPMTMTLPEDFLFSAVLWLDDVPYVCVESGVIEAKLAEDGSRACEIREGASLGVCNTPFRLPIVGASEPCPSAF